MIHAQHLEDICLVFMIEIENIQQQTGGNMTPEETFKQLTLPPIQRDCRTCKHSDMGDHRCTKHKGLVCDVFDNWIEHNLEPEQVWEWDGIHRGTR